MEKELFRKTEELLFRYRTLVSEVDNLKISIETIKEEYQGCSAISYEEKSGSTNKFSSCVENELIAREKEIEKLSKELKKKERLVQKIDNAIKPLPEREREIVQQKYFEKIKSWNRIGEILDLNGEYCRALNQLIVNKVSKVLFIEKYI